MYGLGIEGEVKASHCESQRVWWKPWTWFRKPVRVIDGFELRSLSLVEHPVDPHAGVRRITSKGRIIRDLEATRNMDFPYPPETDL